MKNFLIIMTSIALCSFTLFITQWKYVPENASIKFFVKEVNGEEEGVLKGIVGVANFNENDLNASTITATIELNTINTGVEMRDESLRSADFFEVSKYPTLKFISKQIIKNDTGYCAKGELTIKKTTKPIEIPFQFITTTDSTANFKGSFTINRYDYEIGKKGDGVGNMVRIILDVPVKK